MGGIQSVDSKTDNRLYKSIQFRRMSDLEKGIRQLERDIFFNDTSELQHKLAVQTAHYNELSSNKALANINSQCEKCDRIM